MSIQGVTTHPRRTFQPIRRRSHLAGNEAGFWRPIRRKEAQAILYAAKRFDRINRPWGSRTGPLGNVALEVLELLTRIVSFRTGRLDPSLETIMRHCRRSRDAVVRALANLRRHGFIDWLRRYVPNDQTGPGPRVKQTSNAYALALPALLAATVSRWFGVPRPDDEAHRRETATAEAQEQAFAESPLSASLERLRQAMEARGRRGQMMEGA